MLGKTEVLKRLDEWQIAYECEEHESVLNMAESGTLTLSVSGARCKNLLLQDKAGQFFLVVTTADKSLDLAAAAAILGSKRLSFASADKLFDLLGIRTGSLSPLALVNDEAKRVTLVIDAHLNGETRFLFHPLENTASVSLSRSGLDDFLAHVGHAANWLSLPARAQA
ncbi:prolyl-tRNA synthetase associated domain-containing protein [Paraburkholderia acidisoli]|uniref:Prolyl-tRNA synthetase associated domain-containing protein n=1 Tax=Paraburkholderia acidisoli TaxID=2571748 RepID=A0A7Z2GPP4_9BURK|nr:prolyl-tRNA synthetase associated domain-containing protein [Paraburkholderia acidisoli]QGZ65583.1 prolyl-tRNA synthetase associated domain-containing protein [Paraburkholderia acidisoli]